MEFNWFELQHPKDKEGTKTYEPNNKGNDDDVQVFKFERRHRLHQSREEGERGLVSIQFSVDETIKKLVKHTYIDISSNNGNCT